MKNVTALEIIKLGNDIREEAYKEAAQAIAAWLRTTERDTIHRDAMDAAADLIERGEFKL